MNLAGLILAAGESSRMGRDKALLSYQGTTFLGRLIELFRPRVDPLIVVLGHHAEEIRAALPAAVSPRLVVNPRYRDGMLSSLQTGIAALPESCEAAMFTLVDLPGVSEETIDRLIEEYRSAPADTSRGSEPKGARSLLMIPRCGERRGHPVIATRPILSKIAALAPGTSAKQVIRAHRSATVFVDVDDPGIYEDVDLPEDYERLLQANR